MLELKNVSFSYDKEPVLTNFNLKVQEGKAVCLNGPSGCGKSTVLKLLAGLIKADSGTVIAPNSVSVVFQEDRLLPWFDLEKNLLLTVGKEKQAEIRALLWEVGLGDKLHSKIEDLSGGMKRRASICRAIAFSGDALLLDEPFNGIDKENKQIIANIIKREFIDKGKPVLMSSHITDDAELLDAEIYKFQ